ncbi:hypothetical protein [Vibrio jasicida]|uniref:hypothetical protein n=1 Tax=Vibrio jasicida TaxID=766224 RepID=UPI0005F0B61B|nr:hypothetical protein [Vibrio jasicida]
MAVSHRNYYLAITNSNIQPVKTIDEAIAFAHGKPGGLVKGFDSYQEAVDAIPAIRKDIERRLSKKKPKRNRGNSSYPKNDMSYLKAFLPENQSKKIKVTLTCHFGGKSADSTITGSNGVTDIVLLTLGASAQLKNLELTHAALKWAESSISQGTDLVEIWGVDIHAINTLTDWAPTSRERNWLNASGKPFANRDVVVPMLELYEKLGEKVKLNNGEQPVDNDTPF